VLSDLDHGFGNRTIECARFTPPNDHEKYLAQPGSCAFTGSDSFTIGSDRLDIEIEILILPPEDTSYGAAFANYTPEPGWPQTVSDAYQIEEGLTPADVDCVPVVIITVVMLLDAGTEVVNIVSNYGPSDSTHTCVFDGTPITVGNYDNGTAIVQPTFSMTIDPIRWFSWNGTWNEDTGERL